MANKPIKKTLFKNLVDASPEIKQQYATLEALPTAEEKAYYLFNTMKQTPQQISKRLGGVSIESVLDWVKDPINNATLGA